MGEMEDQMGAVCRVTLKGIFVHLRSKSVVRQSQEDTQGSGNGRLQNRHRESQSLLYVPHTLPEQPRAVFTHTHCGFDRTTSHFRRATRQCTQEHNNQFHAPHSEDRTSLPSDAPSLGLNPTHSSNLSRIARAIRPTDRNSIQSQTQSL